MKNVIVYLHTHWDREWYREFQDFRLRLIDVVKTLFKELDNDFLPCFYFDGQTSFLEDYLQIYPDDKLKIEKFIKEKKIRVGPFYCAGDEFIPTTEAIIRNLEIGMNISKYFGEREFIGYLADTFGHSAKMPSILSYAAIDKAVIWRGTKNIPADFLWNNVQTVRLVEGYFIDILHSDISVEKKAKIIKKILDKISKYSNDTILLPIGADHLNILQSASDIIEQLNKLLKPKYYLKIASPFEYFKNINPTLKVKNELRENVNSYILSGVLSTRVDIKQENFEAENMLINRAEPLQALCHHYFNALNFQNEIDFAFKKLIKNHAHDSIYGCSTDDVSKDVLNRYKNVKEIANGIIKRSIRDIQNSDGLCAINLSNSDFTGIVKIETEKDLSKIGEIYDQKGGFSDDILYNSYKIPITEDYCQIKTWLVPVSNSSKFSMKKIRKTKFDDIKISYNSIENKNLKLSFSNGKLTLKNKNNNNIIDDILKFQDVADIGDSYNFGELKNDTPIFSKIKECSIQSGKFYAKMNVLFEINIPENSTPENRQNGLNHEIFVDFVLYSNAKTIETDVNFKNQSKNHKLQAVFNTNKNIKHTTTEDIVGFIKRSAKVQKSKIEKLTNSTPVRRWVKANDLLIITNGQYEFEPDKNYGKLTMLRAVGIISNPKNPNRKTPAGPPIELPECQMIKDINQKFYIGFSSDNANNIKNADNVILPPLLAFGNYNKTFFNIESSDIRILSIKLCKDKLIVRVANYGQKLHEIPLKYVECDILGEPSTSHSKNIILPNQIKSYIV